MKTTIELPDDLIREIKMRSVLEDRKLKETIADLLRAGLASEDRPKARKEALKKRELPSVKCRRAAVRKKELTPERVAEILSQQEADWYAKARR